MSARVSSASLTRRAKDIGGGGDCSCASVGFALTLPSESTSVSAPRVGSRGSRELVGVDNACDEALDASEVRGGVELRKESPSSSRALPSTSQSSRSLRKLSTESARGMLGTSSKSACPADGDRLNAGSMLDIVPMAMRDAVRVKMTTTCGRLMKEGKRGR
jgi:hypothetical protein